MFFQARRKIRFIVTSGPTREFFDPIRYLSNPSTGRMGFFIAKAALNQGYSVSYICGPVNVQYRSVPGAKNIAVTSTLEMLAAVEKEARENCVLIMAAAPADYRPAQKSKIKLKKTESPVLQLVPNPDILKTMAEYRKKKKLKSFYLIGFAAETHNTEAYARKKLVDKNLDMIFLNDISREGSGFGVDTNQLAVFFHDQSMHQWDPDSKERLGYRIIETVENNLLRKS